MMATLKALVPRLINAFLFAVYLLSGRSSNRILRLPCKGVAEFSIEVKKHWLKGTVIEEHDEVGLFQCYEYCFNNHRCKSINIQAGDYGACQLNNASSHDMMDRANLTADDNWNYRSTNFSNRLLGENCKNKDPCRSDEYCVDTCDCPGFECINCTQNTRGIHCNICASDPCQNGGSCFEGMTPFCQCPGGFEGDFCEKSTGPCIGTPCQNGGTCVPVGTGYNCTCTSDFFGPTCNIPAAGDANCQFADPKITFRNVISMARCYWLCRDHVFSAADFHTAAFLCHCSNSRARSVVSGMNCLDVDHEFLLLNKYGLTTSTEIESQHSVLNCWRRCKEKSYGYVAVELQSSLPLETTIEGITYRCYCSNDRTMEFIDRMSLVTLK